MNLDQRRYSMCLSLASSLLCPVACSFFSEEDWDGALIPQRLVVSIRSRDRGMWGAKLFVPCPFLCTFPAFATLFLLAVFLNQLKKPFLSKTTTKKQRNGQRREEAGSLTVTCLLLLNDEVKSFHNDLKRKR